MSVSSRPDTVARQYASAANLNLRASLHEKYSVNRQGFTKRTGGAALRRFFRDVR